MCGGGALHIMLGLDQLMKLPLALVGHSLSLMHVHVELTSLHIFNHLIVLGENLLTIWGLSVIERGEKSNRTKLKWEKWSDIGSTSHNAVVLGTV